MAVRLEGLMGRGVSAKDVVLAWIAAVGTDGASGHAVEFCGSAVRAMSMDERMTLCNMSIEAGARCGMIAPDETTFAYLEGREEAPVGWDWEAALLAWRALPSDPGAAYDREVTLDVDALEPMITWGTSPGMAMAIGGRVPDAAGDPARERALRTMRSEPGDRMLGRRIDVVFLGSCTNSRLSDLRAAGDVLRGRRVAAGVRCLVVPGSQEVKRQAEAEGLDRVFRDAGAEWRESGCSMCLAMNEDRLAPGELAVSTSNRNFEGRQGAGGRTLLASPWTAAAAAVRGVVTDPRDLMPAI
jgi:3-isopropylmalate/(R)-2-methylmalate dehydratase large subunit